MHQYTCPKCKTILKRQEAVPAGKKIKCPKCTTVFAPASFGPSGKPKTEEEEYESKPYAVSEDKDEEDTMRAEKQRAAMGIVKDRYKKSKRGPAQKKVIQPSNLLTAFGILLGVLCIAAFVIGIFPIAFKDFYLDTPQFKKMDAATRQLEWESIVTYRIILMCSAVVSLIFDSLILMGAFKMRTLESYGWAMTGSIVACLTPPFIVGLMCVMVLRDKAVIEGFAEEPPPPI